MAESHTAEEASLGQVSSNILTPEKARLALTKATDLKEICQIFTEY